MESFDKRMQDKFRDEKSEVSSEYSWENLGPGIMDKVESKKKDRKYLWFLLPLLFLAAGTIGYNLALPNKLASAKNQDVTNAPTKFSNRTTGISQSNSTNEKTLLTTEKIIETSHDKTLSLEISETLDAPLNNGEVTSSGGNSHTSKRIDKLNSVKDNLKVNKTISTGQVDDLIDFTAVQESDASIVSKHSEAEKQSIQRDNNTSSQNIGILGSVSTVEESDKKGGSDSESNSTDAIIKANASSTFGRKPLLEFSSLPTEVKKFPNKDPKVYPKIKTLGKKDKIEGVKPHKPLKTSQYVVFTNQVSLWQIRAKNYDLSNVETGLPSYSNSLQYGYGLSENLTLEGGVGYAKYDSKLDHVFQTITNEFDENAVQTIINRVTGETTQTVGAVAEKTTSRRIVNYNSIHNVSVPLMLNYTVIKSKKLSYVVGIGLKGNVVLSRVGRGINVDGALVEYDQARDSRLYYGQGRIQVHMGYEISKSLGMRLSANYNYGLHDMKWYGIDKRRINDAAIGLGIYYKIK